MELFYAVQIENESLQTIATSIYNSDIHSIVIQNRQPN